MKLNRFTRLSIRKEFPFLVEIVSNDGTFALLDKAETLSIKRMDEDFLRTTPSTYRWTGSMVNCDSGSRLDFVLADGSVITGAVNQAGTSGSNYAYSETSEWEGESVAEAIDRHGVAETLRYVVEYQWGIRTVEHYSEGFAVVLWKPSKEDGLPSRVIARMKGEAQEKLAVEANF